MPNDPLGRKQLMRLGWLAVFALVAGALGWFGLRGNSSGGDFALNSTGPVGDGPGAGEQDAVLYPLDGAQDEEVQVRVGVVEAGLAPMTGNESIGSLPTGDDVLWVHGVVRLDPDTPSDERIQVTAQGRMFKGAKGRREHRVLVAADGSFRVAISKRTKKARFRLSGRYSYLNKKRTWRVGDGQPVELLPKLGAHVHVRVIAESRPFSREEGLAATLDGVSSWDGDPRFHLVRDGELNLAGVPATSSLVLALKAPGFVNHQLGLGVLEPGSSSEIEAVLIQGARIEGRIVDLKGRPFGEGKISVVAQKIHHEMPNLGGRVMIREGALAAERQNVTSTVQGDRFEVIGLPAGDTRLSLKVPGASVPVLELEDLKVGEVRKDVVWEIDTGMSIRGQVLWADGRPAEGALVEVLGLFPYPRTVGVDGVVEYPPGRSCFANDEGRFEFSGFFDSRTLEVMVTGMLATGGKSNGKSPLKAGGFRRKGVIRARVGGIQTGDQDVVLTLRQVAPLVGRVVDDRGQPVSVFSLILIPASTGGVDGTRFGAKAIKLSVRDKGGRFSLEGIAPGSWLVQAKNAKHLDSRMAQVEVPSGTELNLTLVREVSFAGHVLNAAGQPVNAKVIYSRVIDPRARKQVKSRAKQGFAVKNLAPGAYSVFVRGKDGLDSPTQTIELPAGTAVRNLTFRLPSSCRVIGSVHADWWQPGLYVRLVRLNWPKPLRREAGARSTYSGRVTKDGTYAVEGVAAGEYSIYLGSRGSALPWTPVSSQARQQFVALEGQVALVNFAAASADSVVLSGRLLGEETDMAGRTLSFHRVEGGQGAARCFTGIDGDYRVVLDGTGTYRVDCASGGYNASMASWTIEVVGASPQKMDLVLPSCTLTVDVSGPVSGEYPPAVGPRHLEVALIGGDSLYWKSVSRYTSTKAIFDELGPGFYRVRFSPARNGFFNGDLDTGNWALTGTTRVLLESAGEKKTVQANLQLGGQIHGRVTGAPEGQILFVQFDMTEGGDGSGEAAPLEQGGFRLQGVPAGRAWVRCRRMNGDVGPAVSVVVQAGQEYLVNLDYPAGW